ncbi:putative ATP-dependent DEAD/H RNA helicase [Trypanosoma cruzi]|uniref:Putative ATP-dependent DEAD/H RNA helicase n=1 Tax=Trypanosoma cruzi TaxID=5693 RepID=A0A2V2VDT6_TRYCR|nr:putative ATP-dependent DEAD/H RNA helicase [Trypanosoma cruzi]
MFCSVQAWLPEDCIRHGPTEVCTTILRQIQRVVFTALDGQSRIGNVGDSLLFLMPHEAGCIPCVRTLYRQRERDQWLFTGNEAAAAANGRMIIRLVSFHHLTTLDPKREPHVNATHSHLRVHCYSTCREAGWSRQRVTWRRCELERWSRPTRTVCVPIVHAGARRALQRAYKPVFKFVYAHIGHVAHGFLLGKRPGDVWAQLQSFIGEDAKTAREASSLDTQEGGRGCEGF